MTLKLYKVYGDDVVRFVWANDRVALVAMVDGGALGPGTWYTYTDLTWPWPRGVTRKGFLDARKDLARRLRRR